MQGGSVTTPFGRRPVTLALVKRQIATTEIKSVKSADKWKVFRDACEARVMLGLQDRSLAVLDALLTFYPENELRHDAQLIVFPSNAQLAVRAHGIAGATLRRHLAFLVEAGLIFRKDSANGKRFARKDRAGAIESAFGFDISPMLVRAEELAAAAQQVAADRTMFRRTKESLTICRRDVRKLISAALEEGASGDWSQIENNYISLVRSIPRSPTITDLQVSLEEMAHFREEVLKLLNALEDSSNISSNAAQTERHIQNSKSEYNSESEPSSEKEPGEKPSEFPRPMNEPRRSYPLALVLRACPEIVPYGPGGAITDWRDLMTAAVLARSMLGISPSAYQEACEILGPENAAAMIACILERSGHIKSAGGYLRDLVSRAKRGEFSLGPMIMALVRANSDPQRHAG